MKYIHVTETLLVTSKEVGIAVNGEKTNYIFMSCANIWDKITI
jgi:hypothetical protein